MRVPGIPFVQGRNAYSDADGTKYGIAIHNTSNDATAEGEASYATRRTDGVSAHFYCDNDSIVQSLDTAVRAGHAGSGNGNNHAVAVEITGVNGWSREQWLARVAWDKLGQVLAVVCRHYGIAVRRASVDEMRANPKVRAFYGHDDMRRAWGGTTHTDPGGNFPWDRLFQAVNAALGTEGAEDMALTQAEKDEIVYRTATIVLKGVQPAGWADQTAPEPYRGQLRGAATNAAIADTLTALGAGLKAIAAKVDVDPEELAAIQAAAREGALSAGEGLAAAVIAALPEGERITKADVEQAIRSVLGGLDGATPA
jgi:N-acetyl-anhydromuramyl-L-alanine amidase AmpD